VIFNDARKAIEEAKKQKPDLILMDMMLPQFSGAEAIKELKKDPELALIPIIILTGLISPEEYWDMTRMAVDGKAYKTLCKPYEIEELIKAVRESLRWAR
jgi:two-component system sensor histidine kinase/response regulator